MKTKHFVASAVAVTIATTVTASTHASAQQGTVLIEQPELAACVERALQRKSENWTCFGSTLVTPPKNDGGEPAQEQVPTTRWSGQRNFPSSSITPESSAQDGSNSPRSDDYDTWCENGSICHRTRDRYYSETKGNAAFGNAGGVRGAFDVIVRNSLNGRSGRWSLILDWDLGDTVTFNPVSVFCYEDENNWIDSFCGAHPPSNGPITIGPGRSRFNGPYKQGNRLNDPNDYYAVAKGRFSAGGRQYFMADLRTLNFHCPRGAKLCYF